MTYKEALSYLESLIPSERINTIKIDPLERMKALLSLLGNPQDNFVSVQVSGTSGKGSTSYLLAHILSMAGYKTALGTSPHLERVTERMKIDGEEISQETFLQILIQVKAVVEKISETEYGRPTYFETLLAVQFLYFSVQKVDIAVVEVGLEGRYDGTNTLNPILGILTNISIDHVEYLGDTIDKIASEAVGMIKKEMTILTGATQPSVLSIIEKKTSELGARLIVSSKSGSFSIKGSTLDGSVFSYKGSHFDLKDLSLSLIGKYQVENAALVLAALEILSTKEFIVDEDAIRRAFSSAYFNGRFERFEVDGICVVLDSAHNVAKMHAFIEELERLYLGKKKVFIIAFKKAKDLTSITREIQLSADQVIISEFHVTIDTSRNATMRVQEIKKTYDDLYPQVDVLVESDTQKAYEMALVTAKNIGGIVVITGSMYLVGQMRSILAKINRSTAK